jgi:hypothetical protein
MEADGVAVAHVDSAGEAAARTWLRAHLPPALTLAEAAGRALAAWRVLSDGKSDFAAVDITAAPLAVEGRTVELALVERTGGRARYRALDPAAPA